MRDFSRRETEVSVCGTGYGNGSNGEKTEKRRFHLQRDESKSWWEESSNSRGNVSPTRSKLSDLEWYERWAGKQPSER